MKRCPECRRDYYDETLLYCLDDGERLLDGPSSEEPATAIQANPTDEIRTKLFEGANSDNSEAASTRNSLMFGALGILLVTAIGLGSYVYYGRESSKAIDSIAVMPFVNESGNPEFEYVADGVMDELITSLTRLSGITVKPRSTVIRYKGQNADAKTLGREMQVAAILNGSVALRGQEVALHVELIDAATDSLLWSDNYRKPLSALATLHNEIARDISAQMRTKLSSDEQQKLARKYTDNPEAYQLYRKARFHWNKRAKDDTYKSIDYYQQAIKLDPNYALAYAGLADAYMNLPGYDRTVTQRESGPKAREYAIKAISLDDSLSEAHVAMGRVLMYHDHDFGGAERELKRAVVLDPNNAFAIYTYAGLLTSLGRRDEAEANYLKAIGLEPESPELVRGYAWSLTMRRRYDEAEVQLRKAIDLEPTRAVTHYTLCSFYFLRKRYADAVEACARSREIIGNPEAAVEMRETFARSGFEGFVRGLADDKWPGTGRNTYILATFDAILGEKEKALDKLEKSYEDREGFIPIINIDPRFDELRDDPRFAALVKKVGL